MRALAPAPAPALLAALLVATALFVTGCFGGSSPQRTYYTMQYPTEQLWSYAEPRYPFEVRVERLDSDAAYDRQEMVYRSNPHEFRYYTYRLWSAKPRKMLREVMQRHLRTTNLFRNVTLEIDDRLPDYDLIVEIIAIEELNADQETWFAHLAMRFALVRFETGKRVWEYSFDRRKEVYNREPVYVVRALSEIAEEEFGKAFAALDQYLAEETGMEAPPGGPGSSALARSGGADRDGATVERDEPGDTRVTDPVTQPADDGPSATLKKRKK